MKKNTHIKSGFTLIELMVVISIISLLSSIMFVTVSVAKAKANDTKKIADARAVKTAIQSYISDNNVAPPSYSCSGGTCTQVAGGTEEVGDKSGGSSDLAYKQTMQTLVSKGYLSTIPVSPDDTPYAYVDYGSGTSIGATFTVVLKTGVSSSGNVSPILAGSSCQLAVASCHPIYNDQGQPTGGPDVDCEYTPPNLVPHTVNLGGYQLTVSSCSFEKAPDGSIVHYGGYDSVCNQPPQCVSGTNSYCACNSY